jgi:hypothetical protein
MRIVICSILLGCFIPPWSSATVLQEIHRDRLILCSQVIINDPAQAIIENLADDCCNSGDRIRDCHLYDWASPMRFRPVGHP